MIIQPCEGRPCTAHRRLLAAVTICLDLPRSSHFSHFSRSLTCTPLDVLQATSIQLLDRSLSRPSRPRPVALSPQGALLPIQPKDPPCPAHDLNRDGASCCPQRCERRGPRRDAWQGGRWRRLQHQSARCGWRQSDLWPADRAASFAERRHVTRQTWFAPGAAAGPRRCPRLLRWLGWRRWHRRRGSWQRGGSGGSKLPRGRTEAPLQLVLHRRRAL